MSALSDGEVLYFCVDPELHAMKEHREKGGRGVFLRNGALILAEGLDERELMPSFDMPALGGNAPKSDAETLLAAVAAAWALNLDLELIQTGIATWTPPGLRNQLALRNAESWKK
jgi:cyanophycin synthetase